MKYLLLLVIATVAFAAPAEQVNNLICSVFYQISWFSYNLENFTSYLFLRLFCFVGDWWRFCRWGGSARKKKFWALKLPISTARRYPSIRQVGLNKSISFVSNQGYFTSCHVKFLCKEAFYIISFQEKLRTSQFIVGSSRWHPQIWKVSLRYDYQKFMKH